MTESLTAPELTLLFLIVVVCLLAAFVCAFWEIEQGRLRRQRKAESGKRRTVG